MEMIVAPVKAISGRTVFEVQHVKDNGNQTLSEPFVEEMDAIMHMNHLAAVRGTEHDLLNCYWNKFDHLDKAIAYAVEFNYDFIGYHTYSVKGGYYFAYRNSFGLQDCEYEYMKIGGAA